MILNKIKISGFKSFAKDTSLEFTNPITAIVGPNGSGKSNIADAFRFVLGESSSKNLRGETPEDIIWSGSTHHPRHHRAHAEIHISNDSNVFDAPFASLVLERALHRDRTNEYRINSSKVRKKDTSKLLSSATIGSSRHNIIGQGESDRLIHSSPQELAVMLEDVIGLRPLILEKKDVDQSLIRSKESYDELIAARLALEPHRIESERALLELRKNLEIRDELTRLSSQYLISTAQEIEADEVSLINQRTLAQEVLEEVMSAEDVNSSQIDYELHYKEAISDIKERSREASLTLRSRERVRDQITYQLERAVEELEEISTREIAVTVSNENKDSSLFMMIPAHLVAQLNELIDAYRETHRTKTRILVKLADSIIEILEDSQKEISLKVNKSDKKIPNNTTKEDNISERIKDLSKALQEADESIAAAEQDVQLIEAEEMTAIELLSTISSSIKEQKDKEIKLTAARHDFDLSTHMLSELEEKKINLGRDMEELSKVCGMGVLRTVDSLQENSGKVANTDVLNLRRSIDRLLGSIKGVEFESISRVEKEYNRISEECIHLENEQKDIIGSITKLSKLSNELEVTYFTRLEEGVSSISDLFSKHFVTMFGGGGAGISISVSDSGERKASISVEMPFKKVKGLLQLSGGERTLVSLALLFACTLFNPPPFIILDETDAALDEANSRRYAELLTELSTHTQLIIITHNREVMLKAGKLYGITMGKDGMSHVLSVSLDRELQQK